MLYMFLYPVLWYFWYSNIPQQNDLEEEKHTIYHVLQIPSLLICIHSQRCGFHNTNDTFDTCMHRLICGWGDNITTCITLYLFKYIDILLKKIERLFKALKSTARSRICLEKSSAILFFSMSRNTNYVYGHLHKENISTPITIHWQPTHHYDQVLPKTTKAELLQGDYKKGLQEKIIAALVHSRG